MSSRQFAWIAVVGVAVIFLSVGQVHAGAMRFGTSDEIHVIQPTKDPQFDLCYKASIHWFIAGCYVTDDGYVLRKKGESKYLPLTAAQISELQDEGSLPTPMPKYSLSFFDYLFGYSLWIVILIVIGISVIKWAFSKSRYVVVTLALTPDGESAAKKTS